MGAMLDGVRSGDWVTRERMRLVAFGLLIAFAAGLAWLAATANGLNDALGRPLGTDFSNVYAAGTLVQDGRPQAPFDPALQYAREQAIFGAETPFYGWHYPPLFLFIAAALALMPYKLASVVWQGATLALYLVVLRAIMVGSMPGTSPRLRLSYSHISVGRHFLWRGAASPSPRLRGAGAYSDAQIRGEAASPSVQEHADLSPRAGRGTGSAWTGVDPLWLVLALAFPAVFINLGHGHNGFLTAALIGAALATLDRRPLLAGLLLGLIAYKPQFGILIPLVLAATARWRAFAAAAATVAALALITTLAFGIPVWDAFLTSTHFTRIIVLEAGETGWHKIQSVFSLVRMWGGPVALAYAAQSAVTVALAAALVWLWRAQVDFALKAAALIIASILATPYSLDYDMTVLAPAIAFLAVDGLRRGFAPYEKSALAALWIAPLVARSVAQAVVVPVGVLAMAVMLWLILHRAAQETRLFERLDPFRHPAG
jgi:alpha-1,2-mannosyltransferase